MVKYCKLFLKSAKKHLKDPRINKKFLEFVKAKTINPKAKFGSSDSPANSKAPLGKAVPGIMHAHLTRDLSAWYIIQDNDVCIYGIFRHADTGTGTPSRTNIQQQAATRFKNQQF